MKKLLTEKEIEDIVSDVYQLETPADINEDDVNWAKGVFKEPEDFHRLRRILRVLVDNERGIAYQEDISSIVGDDDLKKYAIDVKVHNATQERIRGALLGFYQLMKNEYRKEKRAEIEAEENQKKKENEKLKEMSKVKEQIKNPFGKNL